MKRQLGSLADMQHGGLRWGGPAVMQLGGLVVGNGVHYAMHGGGEVRIDDKHNNEVECCTR